MLPDLAENTMGSVDDSLDEGSFPSQVLADRELLLEQKTVAAERSLAATQVAERAAIHARTLRALRRGA